MKSFIILAVLAAVALSAPVDQQTTIVKEYNDNIGVDKFSAGVETSDGTKIDQQGQLTNAGTENEAFVLRGSYSYYAPDGQLISVTYVADENGYRAEGAHLPKN